MFTKVNHTSTLYTGSLETEMGGIVYYGFDTSKGLMWLERSPKEKYSKVDNIWDEAERFLITSTKQNGLPISNKTVTKTIARQHNMGSVEYEEHEGHDALASYESENDKIFAEMDDDKLMNRANQLLQVGLEDYLNGF